jgi:hypothetical protein
MFNCIGEPNPRSFTVTGRLEYAIGCIIEQLEDVESQRRRRRLQSLLIVVEAKATQAVG